MLKRVRALRTQGATFAFETTLASRYYLRFLQEAQDAGYIVHLIYIWLSSVELARSRVAIRVRQGGHDVPPDVVERRYWRGLGHFFDLYRPLADTWTLCDNSGDEVVIVARGAREGPETVLDQKRYALIKRMKRDAPA